MRAGAKLCRFQKGWSANVLMLSVGAGLSVMTHLKKTYFFKIIDVPATATTSHPSLPSLFKAVSTWLLFIIPASITLYWKFLAAYEGAGKPKKDTTKLAHNKMPKITILALRKTDFISLPRLRQKSLAAATTIEFTAAAIRCPVDLIVYARHGRELMGCKSPVREPGGIHSNGYYQKYKPKARASPRGGVWRKPNGNGSTSSPRETEPVLSGVEGDRNRI